MKATGMLAHYFHGDYSAGIALAFESPEDAASALAMLEKYGFKVSPREVRALVARIDSDTLDRFKASEAHRIAILPCGFRHCKKQCRDAAIDNLHHSVDVGARFTWDSEGAPLPKPKRARRRKAPPAAQASLPLPSDLPSEVPANADEAKAFLHSHVTIKIVR